MKGQQKEAVLVAHLQNQSPQHLPLGEVERLAGLCLGNGEPPSLGIGQVAQIHHGHRQRLGRVDHLVGLASGHGVAGAQDLVAMHQVAEGGLQAREVEGAPEVEEQGEVVGGDAGVQVVEKPEALLGERQRETLRPGLGH